MVMLGRYSLGMGDRFAHQAAAQLRAWVVAADVGVGIVPVGSEYNREHVEVGSERCTVRAGAHKAVRERGWQGSWHVDADHINLGTVDRFLTSSDFFTIDVADSIGRAADADVVRDFADRHPELAGEIAVPGVAGTFQLK